MNRRLGSLFVGAMLLVGWSAQLAAAEDLRPSWTCLTEDTVVVVRLPSPQAFLDALRARTKLGKVVLNQDRIEQLITIIREESDDDWEEFNAGLEKVGLKPDDLLNLFSGELGYAVSLHTEDETQAIGLAWLEPGEDLAKRLLDAIKQGVELQDGDDPKIQRFDMEMAGHEVLRLSFPNMHSHYDSEAEKVVRYESGRVQMLITRIDGRLLMAHTYGSDHLPAMEEGGAEAAVDPDAGLDACQQTFGRFLEAHRDDSLGTMPKLLEVPGVAEALPSGVPFLEVVFDPRPLLAMADEADDPMVGRILEAIGVAEAGPIVMRSALDGSVLRSGLFVSLPAPRTGLMTLLDQPPLDPEPPAWVPADVMQYTHISFDLGKAYSQIKELALAEAGPQAAGGFAMVEAQVQAAVQADLPTVLSSLGQRHAFITLPAVAAPPMDELMVVSAVPANRMGVFWQVKDEALWTRILQTVSALAGQEIVEEQGFRGLRPPDGGEVHGGVFLGQEHLVLGIGKDVVEKMLAALRTPPTDSLRASPLMSHAREIMTIEPGLSFSITDGNRSMQSTVDTFNATFEMLEKHPGALDDDDDPEAAAKKKRVRDRLRAILPSKAELEGVLGVNVDQTQMTDQGLVNRSAVELPPAE